MTSESGNPDIRDAEEAASLHRILADEIVPLFYEGQVPQSASWLAKVRHNWKTLGPFVTAARMVNEYDTRLYRPDRNS